MIVEQAITPSIKLIDLSEISVDSDTIENTLSRERVNYIYLNNKYKLRYTEALAAIYFNIFLVRCIILVLSFIVK